MPKLNGIQIFFLLCSFLAFGAELHRAVTSPLPESSPPEPDTIEKASVKSSDFVFPVPGKSKADIIGKFGEPRGGGRRIHEGVDIAAARGTPVVAFAEGTVTKVKEGGNGGKQVWVECQNRNWTYYYAHLHSQSVKPGEVVAPGDKLGTVGSTGNAPAHCPHLHFSIYEPGMKAIDPLPLLP